MMAPCLAAILVADALGLDFLNTIAKPIDIPVEWISSGEDFLDWAEQAKLDPALPRSIESSSKTI